MIRELIPNRLFIADIEGCKCKAPALGDRIAARIHACKNPCHFGRVGQLTPADRRYIGFEEGGDLFLNIIDPKQPLFQRATFEYFLRFARDNWLDERPLLIHCNAGKSRSVTLAILLMAKVLGELPNSSYDDAWDAFEERFGPYTPSEGIEGWMRENWNSLRETPLMHAAARAKFQQYDPPELGDVEPDAAMALLQGSPIIHFASMVTIEDKRHERVKPVPNILQMRVDEAYQRSIQRGIAPRLIVLKPRQVGCSTICGHLCYHHARRYRVDGLIIGDEGSRTMKVWQIFTEYSTHDEFPWNSSFYFDTKKARVTYSDGTVGEWEYDTANDPKAGISGTRQVIWYTEAARYSKQGARTDLKVITASLNSLAKVQHSLAIAESTADGACYDAKTEVLTDEGWKFFKDLTGSEAILSKNRDTGVAYYESFWQKQVHSYRGSMVKIATRTVNLRVTANHQMWCSRQKGKMKMQPARSMLGTATDFYFDRAMKWTADGIDGFELPSYRHRQGNGWRTIPEKHIPMNIWLRFLGHWLSDGHVTFIKGNKSVALTQVKFIKEFHRSARDLAEVLGCKIREVKHGNGMRWIFEHAQLAAYLVNFTKPKRIPRALLMDMSQEQCLLLMKAIYEGDGDQDKARSTTCQQGKIYCGLDKQLQDDIQELALKCGYATSAYGPQNNRVATFTESTRATVRHNNPPIEEKNCVEDVYCVTLPRDHLLMVRRGGTAVWCGNSGWFYDNWQAAVTLEDFKAGLFGNGWVKIFAAWFEFSEHTLPREPQYEHYFHKDLTQREKRGIQMYGWDENQIAWRRSTIESACGGDEAIFDQDYPENDRDCFLQSGRPRFDDDGVTRLEIMAGAEHDLAELGVLTGEEMDILFTPVKDAPWLWLKEKPIPGCAYIGFIDPCTGEQSKGAKKPDAHAAGILRRAYIDEGGRYYPTELVAAIDVRGGCRWDDTLIAERVAMLANYFGGVMVVPETGNGLGVLVKLRDFRVNVFQRMKEDSFQPGKFMPVAGWETNTATRDLWVGAMADAIREQEKAFNCCYEPAVEEMRTFVINDRGKAEAKSGCHDDWVAGIGIGLYCIKFAGTYRPKSKFADLSHAGAKSGKSPFSY